MGPQPIRWDNIGGGGISEAARPLDSAASLFSNALGGLNSILQQKEAVDAQNWQTTKTNNTNKFLNDLYAKYTDASSLDAAIKSGDIAKQLAGYGQQIDMGAVRGAADARMQGLMQQASQKIAYDHAMTDERVAPIVDAAHAAALKGDTAAFNQFAAQYQAAGGRNLSDVLAYKDQRDREMTLRDQSNKTFDLNQRKGNAEITNMQGMLGVAQQNAGTNAAQVANQKAFQDWQIKTGNADRAQAQAAGMAQAVKNSLNDNGNLYAQGIYTGNQADELRKFMKDNNIAGGNPDKQAEMLNFLNDLQVKGIPVKGPNGRPMVDGKGNPVLIHDIPMAAVKAAMGSATNDFWNIGWNTAPAKNMRDNLMTILGAYTKTDNGQLDSKALADQQTFNDALQRVRDNAPGLRPANASYSTPTKKK